jgi:hypothetical protein
MNRTTTRISAMIITAAFALGVGPLGSSAGASDIPSRFVGKGDVQTVLGWNNAALQSSASSVSFRTVSSVASELNWTCVNDLNEKVQERNRTEIIAIENVFQTVARDRRGQVTGFILEPGESRVTVVSSGPKLNSCPEGPWELAEPASTIEPAGLDTVDGPTPVLEVSADGTAWIAIG